MPPAELCELTLVSEHPPLLAAFYEQALGLRRISTGEDRIWLAVGERARIGIWSPGRKEFGDQGGRHVHFAMSVSPGTLDDMGRALRARGLAPRGPVEHEGGDRSLYLRDPEDNVVELWDFFTRTRGREKGVEALGE